MFEILFIIAVIAELALVPLFLKYYWPDRCKKSFITKTVCSLLFVLCGIFAVKAMGNNTLFADYIVWGLVFGMAGDLLLHSLTENKLPFIIGVVAFLIGHIFYIMAFQRAIYTTGLNPSAFTWYEAVAILAILALALIYAFKTNVFKRKGAMAYGLLVYGIVLAMMLVKGLRYAIGEIVYGTNDHMFMVSLTVGLGAVLFFISDLSLGVILSDDKPAKRGMRIFNIGTYYTAQLLLAASIFFVSSRELY